MRKVLLFAAVTAIAFLYSCKTKVSDEIVPQITEDDLIELDGDLDDNFLSSWEYIDYASYDVVQMFGKPINLLDDVKSILLRNNNNTVFFKKNIPLQI